MKFTIRAFTNNGLSTVGKVEGDWSALAEEVLRVQSEGDEFHLAECCEGYIENYLSDNDEVVTWKEVLDTACDNVMHCNAPFIYNGNNKQITSYPAKVYQTLMAIGEAQCKAYFDKEEYVHPDFTKKTKTTSSSKKTRANYPGVYPAGTKKNPGRFVAYYRKDMQTIKIGFFNSEAEAIDAKKAIVEPKTK